MVFSSGEVKLIEEMQKHMQDISAYLLRDGKSIDAYPDLKKVLNIVTNKDPKGMKNVFAHLNGGFRMIDESMSYDAELDSKMDEAYLLSKQEFFGGCA